ncbi:RNA polymerase sigma factor [Sinomicrobium weinanense]|uniref:RNA polymerase sigma-70 factor n=1 Tax=Sinomicrobium weinanense TaxID=2842200 RepID=A0A926JSZ7_9FLAO|nr:RNA polymerase sigma-70 factor [Sinomicrobium weinanense]MBC9796816.1 RNA polymerase sigma-70 factor [Sinomicrobium weinanense]MBU3123680.1 RNA polymerase sigma-70 factor [Sinomicrobium weinanense]
MNKSIIKSIKEDDEKAFYTFFTEYYNRLFAYTLSYVMDRDMAEDITQQAFVNFWLNRKKIDENDSPKSYLFATAYHLYVDHFRRKKLRYSLLDQLKARAIEENEKESEELIEKRIQRLKMTIDTLPDRCKRILEMNKIEGLKYREISEILGISVKTVESQMRIAFQKIREAFKDEELFLIFLLRTLKKQERLLLNTA